MSDSRLTAIRDLIQEDIGNRGLRADPDVNLVNLTLPDFEAACRSIAETPKAAVAVVTGFFIPHATPPAGETDGPLGALFLARALTPLGIRVVLATDAFCVPALRAGLEACKLSETVPLVSLPPPAESGDADTYRLRFREQAGPLTHRIALERVGPGCDGRCHTMRGLDITDRMSPAHWLFAPEPGVTTIGIGDGGNEIGMGKLPVDVIRRNIPRGEVVACQVATNHLIVCGISNWGAYALATGVRLLHGAAANPELYKVDREHELLRLMVERGPLVDGVKGMPSDSVDGLTFERYAEPLRRMGTIT